MGPVSFLSRATFSPLMASIIIPALLYASMTLSFKSSLIGKAENAISGATDAQIGPSKRQNDRVEEYYAIM